MLLPVEEVESESPFERDNPDAEVTYLELFEEIVLEFGFVLVRNTVLPVGIPEIVMYEEDADISNTFGLIELS